MKPCVTCFFVQHTGDTVTQGLHPSFDISNDMHHMVVDKVPFSETTTAIETKLLRELLTRIITNNKLTQIILTQHNTCRATNKSQLVSASNI